MSLSLEMTRLVLELNRAWLSIMSIIKGAQNDRSCAVLMTEFAWCRSVVLSCYFYN